MTGSFDGNDGNDGNAANSGGGGNATSTSSGWYFADRVDLPFVTTPDSGPRSVPPQTIGQLTIIPDIVRFPARNWSAEWFSWLALIEFAASNWQNIQPANPPPPPFQQVLAELGACSAASHRSSYELGDAEPCGRAGGDRRPRNRGGQ